MEKAQRVRSRAIVLGAIFGGFLAGCLVMSLRPSRPGFLNNLSPLQEKNETLNSGSDTVSYYTMPSDWKKIVAEARRELPNAFERDLMVGGLRAKVLTVPRFENGRRQVFYPPAEEITFMPRRLAVGKDGGIVAVNDVRCPWTGVLMREYRTPRPLDGIVEWIHRNLKV